MRNVSTLLEQVSLSTVDVATLFEQNDPGFLADLFHAADTLRTRINGDVVTYALNHNINFTNVCAIDCSFCNFRADRGAPDAYFHSVQDILENLRKDPFPIYEVCIQGGLHPQISLSYLGDLITSIHEQFPHIHIHAFSPEEVFFFSKKFKMSYEAVLGYFQERGLQSMPGTAAEILVDRVREIICPQKMKTQDWVDVVKTAHHMGIPTSCTILFGHIETAADRAEHMAIFKEIQEETGGFTEFVPLPFVPYQTKLGKSHHIREMSLVDSLKMYAISRLYYRTSIPNIQISWVKLGLEGSLAGLQSGANDFGGTLMEETISQSAGACHGSMLPPNQIEAEIKKIGRVPKQRDPLYNLIETPEFVLS